MAEGRLRKLVETVEDRTGITIERKERVQLLEASDWQRRTLQKDLDLLAYTALDYFGGNEQDLKAVERRKLAQRSRVAWQKDPQAGAAVDLQNDFIFGRGVPKPKCADPKVQETVDEAWDDPDNKLILTTYAAQLALGVDLSTQSNVFFLVFDNGADGKIKIGILEHDAVENVVRDENFRHRILYYVARRKIVKWDYLNDQAQVVSERDRDTVIDRPVLYFGHWENIEIAKKENPSLELAPENKLGKGKVFHLFINKTTEAAFGHPVMDRTLRWFTAYNCHDEATEALTDEGWLGLQELERRWADGTVPRLAGYDTDGETMLWEKPQDFNVQPFDGEMLRFSAATGLDMLVTPNHRMLVRTGKGDWRFVEANAVPAHRYAQAPVVAELAGTHVEEFVLAGVPISTRARAAHGRLRAEGLYEADDPLTETREFRVPMDAWLRWLGWWIAEGWTGAKVCQSVNSESIEMLKEVCDALGIPGRSALRRNGEMWDWSPTAAHKQISEWLADNAGVGARDKRIPSFVFDLAVEQRMELLRGLMAGDGTPTEWEERGRGWLATSSIQLAEDAQRLATLCGWRATLKKVLIRGTEHYRVHLVKRNTRRLPQGVPEAYRGRVWCFQMPSGTMVTRRNGCVAISGNTFMEARVDMARAAAALIMKRKVQGTPNQVQKMATQMLSRRNVLGQAIGEVEPGVNIGPKAASTVTENTEVSHEAIKLDSGSANAETDGQMIRSQISAATHFPQHYLGDAGSANLATATCHDDKTEALTSEGWMGLKALKERDAAGTLPLIAAFDLQREALVYERAEKGLRLYDYDGEMVELRNSRHADMLVTPNHRMLVRKDATSAYEFVEAGNLGKRRWEVRTAAPLAGGERIEEFVLPSHVIGHRGRSAESERRQKRIMALVSAGHTNVDIASEVGVPASTVSRVRSGKASLVREARPAVTMKMDAWLRWLGWWIAEGSEEATVYQSEDSAWFEEVRQACADLDIEGVEGYKKGRGSARTWYWKPRNPSQFMAWLNEHVGCGAANKRVPAFVFALEADQQRQLLRGLMGGDGHAPDGWETQGNSVFHTTSQTLADDVQRLALACGFFARLRCLSTYQTKRGERSAYTVSLYRGSSKRKLDSHGRLPVPVRRSYKGQVWCFSLPSTTMVTRRNGVVAIAGQSMELPVLKHIESGQEVFEGLFRWFVDKVIERAVETGRIPKELTAEEIEEQKTEEDAKAANREKELAPQLPISPSPADGKGPTALQAAHADAVEDEAETERDLSYEFSMPSPLRRMLGDLTNAIESIAKTFDPNGTNIELSRVLLNVALGEGLEIEDPAAVVERVFPPGYEDPALASALNQQRMGMQPEGEEGEGEGDNPYGGRMKASTPEENPYGAQEARRAFEVNVIAGRGGTPIRIQQARFSQLPAADRTRSQDHTQNVLDRFDEDVIGRAEQALGEMLENHDG